MRKAVLLKSYCPEAVSEAMRIIQHDPDISRIIWPEDTSEVSQVFEPCEIVDLDKAPEIDRISKIRYCEAWIV